MKFDQVFSVIGEFGRYQLLLCVLLWIMCGWPSPVVTIVYTLFELPHWCRVAGLEHLPADQQRALAVPWNEDDQQYDSCHRYNVSFANTTITRQLGNMTQEDIVSQYNLTHEDIVPCDEWVFDHTDYGRTMVEKFQLVCDRRYLRSVVNTLFIFGMIVGSLLSGILSDKFGRKKTLFGMILLANLSWVSVIVAPSFIFLAVCRFLVAVGRMGAYSGGFLMCMEILGPHWRSHVTIVYNVFFAFGYMLISGIAYAIKDSVNFDIVCLIPHFFFFAFWFVLPESPRWLLVNEKIDEAKKVLSKIGKGNGNALPKSMDCHKIEVQRNTKESGNALDIFRYPNLRKRLFILSYNWFSANLLYYALTFNSKALIPGNFYLNNFLLATVEVPGCLIGWVLCAHRWAGRRGAALVCLIVPGLCGMVTVPFALYQVDGGVAAMSLVGKMFITAAFNVIYVYTAELFPTEIRHTGFGIANVLGRVGGMASTFFCDQLVSIWKPLPYIIFGIVGISSALLNLLLPETLDQPLCDTIAEAEVFGTKVQKKPETLIKEVTYEKESDKITEKTDNNIGVDPGKISRVSNIDELDHLFDGNNFRKSHNNTNVNVDL